MLVIPEKEKIKNIVFDFGDVIVNLDKQATKHELNKLGLTELDSEMIEMNQQYETGKIDTDDFIDFYQKKIPKASREELIEAWNSIFLDLPRYRIDFIKELSKDYNIYLLSNINPLHLKKIRSMLGDDLYIEFLYLFNMVFYSHLTQFRKPNDAPFSFLAERAKIISEESLFIDDTLENCETAIKIGYKAWHIHPETDDIIDLKKYL